MLKSSMMIMKKELRFISNCFNLDYQPDCSRQSIEKLIKQGLDWDFILKKIFQSDIAPIAYHNITKLENRAIPDWVVKKLGDAYNYNIMRNLFIWKSMHEILNILQTENIRVVPLKGVFMVDVIYNDVGLRTLADIDFMAKISQIKKIDAILKNNSYLKQRGIPGQIVYTKSKGESNIKVCVEIHYELGLPPEIQVPSEFLFNNTVVKEIDGTRITYPSIENSLIYSALHFFHHFSLSFLWRFPFSSLKSILDIHEIISRKKEQIDWDYILELSKKYKIRYILYLSTYLSRKYFGTDIPRKVRDCIRPCFLKEIFLRLFFNNYINMQGHRYNYNTLFLHLLLLENWDFANKILCPIGEFAKKYNLPYPSIKALVFYALRPLFWIRNLVLTIFFKDSN